VVFEEEAISLAVKEIAPYDEPFALFASISKGETTLVLTTPIPWKTHMIPMEKSWNCRFQSSKIERL